MWPSEPGVGRFGLPADFGPPSPMDDPNLDAKYMIYDPRVCDMPSNVARRSEKPIAKSAINDANAASHKLSLLLRHHNPRIQPFNNGG
eukprot:9158830-Heterocapsa_arctica.AAC.1